MPNPAIHEPVLTAVTVLLTAAAALLVAFGVHLSDVQVGAITQFVEAAYGLGFLVRSRVTPNAHLPVIVPASSTTATGSAAVVVASGVAPPGE